MYNGKVVIFPGRFQPMHMGHESVLQQMIAEAPNATKVLGVIINEASNNSIDPNSLAVVGNEHHLPERNPLPLDCRLRIAVKASQVADGQVLCTALPRPELHWDLVCAMFPRNRVWVVPDEGEGFDENKVVFFTDKGDIVLRIRPKVFIDGRSTRESLLAGTENWRKTVPNYMHGILIQAVERRGQ